MSAKTRESATMKRIEKKRRAKRLRLARNIALGLTGLFGLASMRPAEAATTVTVDYAYGNSDRTDEALINVPVLTGDVSGATLTLKQGDNVTKSARGGATTDGDVTGNTLTISGGTVGDGAAGGLTNNGDAKNNHAIIEDSTLTIGEVYGGLATRGAVHTNSVEITNSEVTLTKKDKEIKGGYTLQAGAAATGNSVTITKSKVTGASRLYGADARGNTVTGNTVAIQTGSEVEAKAVRGGYLDSYMGGAGGTLEKNGVTVTGSKLTSTGSAGDGWGIWGGYENYYESTAQNNFVKIEEGSTVSTEAYIIGAEISKGNVTNNEITVTGKSTVTAEKVIGGRVGGKGGVVESNTVTITDSTVNGKEDTNGNITGIITGGETLKGSAIENHVTITNSQAPVSAVIGGRAEGTGELSKLNTVTIEEKSNVTATVTGGSGFAYAEAEQNTVTISDSKVTGDVRGGFSKTGAAKENTVEMKDGTVTGSVYGGHSDSATADVKTGNKLIISGANTVSNEVKNFETVKLAADTEWAPDTTVLSAKSFTNVDGLDISEAANLADAVTSGTMTLLNLAESSFGTGDGLKATYDGGTATLTTANNSVVVKETAETTKGLTNGVTLTTGSTKHTVSLDKDNSYKSVLYTIEGDGSVKKVDLSNWNGTGSASMADYTGTKVPVATGDTFKKIPTEDTVILTATTADFFGDVTGGMAYSATGSPFNITTEEGVTLSGNTAGGVKKEDSGKTLKYYAETMGVQEVAQESMTWDDGLAAATGYGFAGVTSIDASKLNFKFADTDKAALHKGSTMTLVDKATGLTAGATVTGKPTQTVDYKVNGAALTGTLTGTVSTTAGAVNYQADSMTLDSVKLAGWDGTAGAVPTGWTANASGVGVDTDGMNMKTLPTATANILTTKTANYFTKDKITGENQYKETTSTEGDKGGAVTLTVTQTKGVTTNADSSALVYEAGKTKQVTDLALGTVAFVAGTTPLYTASDDAYAYKGVKVNTDKLAVTFATPLEVEAEDSMALLAANATLADIAEQTKTSSYTASVTEAPGLTLSGDITGKLAKTDDTVTYAVTENKANTLTFGEMDWADGATLMDHGATLTNVSFDGAKVDTSAIKFKDLEELKDGDKTLIANYGGKPGEIVGESYSVGAGVRGKGKAVMDGGDLVFNATAESAIPDDAVTHSVVMGAEAGMATLTTGNDFIGSATEGLALASNTGADGVSAYARLGGGKLRQETGSHVDVNTWNAIIALGHVNAKEKSTTQYGAFFEYGKGNYTTHSDGERGDGSMHYTGGGLLAKWKQAGGFYIEGSLRAGSVHDDARNVLRDAVQGYSYDTSAGYFGAHLGLGKEIEVSGGNTVDVYAKYFHNRKNSVSFDAGGNHYDLDAVTSSVLRIGARYTMKREAWNFYGGLAYEHELDGKAAGKVDGLDIRAADIGGGSARLELGATMTPEKSPWSLDLNLTGFAGKKKGLMGGVSVSFLF